MDRKQQDNHAGESAAPESRHGHLREVAAVFLRLGLTAFGGPAAHIAMMREEMVTRRKWVSQAQFIDLFGLANIIPGPTSTEMAIYLGYLRAGWPGLMLGGICFIAPAMLIVMALGWLYVTYGALPQAGARCSRAPGRWPVAQRWWRCTCLV